MKRHGFTTIEIILGIGIFALILSLSSIPLSGLLTKSHIDTAARDVTQLIRVAQSNASARYRNSQWGLQVNASEKRFTLFAGESYATRNTQYDLVHTLVTSLAVENIQFSGGGNEVVFQRGNGIALQTGSFELSQNNGNRYRLTINELGQINAEKL